MEIANLYQSLDRLRESEIIANAFTSDYDHPDAAVLTEFAEFFYEHYQNQMPPWMETFYQIYCWQFQSFHEGVGTYYENFYGDSDYKAIMPTVRYLEQNQYIEVAEKYKLGAAKCERYQYPEGKRPLLVTIDKWLNWNTEIVFNFYVDILEKNRAELLI